MSAKPRNQVWSPNFSLTPCFICLVVILALAARLPHAQIAFTLPADAVASSARAVSLVGTFNDWNVDAAPMARVVGGRDTPVPQGTTWTARLALPDGRHFYKFVWRDAAGATHWMNDPRNPFIADNGDRGANNFIDVAGGARVERLDGLETFQWPPPTTQTVAATDGTRTWPVTRHAVMHSSLTARLQPRQWVAVAGDFNDWRLGQFPLARCPDGVWRAHIPIRRPFTYKIIVDGIWREDPGNAPPPTVWMLPNQKPRVVPSTAIGRVPDGFGKFNSHRAQANVTSPGLVAIDRSVAPGDLSELDAVTSYIRSCDYGRAVAMARKIRAANEAQGGELPARIALDAAALEAKAHKRWARFDEAAVCWQAILAADRSTTSAREAALDLASYELFVKRDYAGARAVYEWAIRKGMFTTDGLSIFTRYITATLQERRYPETLATIDIAFENFSKPDGRDKSYAAEYTELLLAKGISHFNLKEWDQARQAFEKVIEIHPWSDSQNVQRARQWLGYVEARRIDPQDVY